MVFQEVGDITMATTGHKVTPQKGAKAALISKMQVFLEAYRETGNVTRSTLIAKVSRGTSPKTSS